MKHLRKEDLEWWSASSARSTQALHFILFEGVVNLRRRLIRVYADVENAVGMPPEKLRNHIRTTSEMRQQILLFLQNGIRMH